jgi:transcriptional regulator with XRE-family HTH domain
MITERFLELGYTHDNFVALMAAAGIGQHELARRVGVSNVTVWRWVTAQHGISPPSWKRIIKACASNKPIYPI